MPLPAHRYNRPYHAPGLHNQHPQSFRLFLVTYSITRRPDYNRYSARVQRLCTKTVGSKHSTNTHQNPVTASWPLQIFGQSIVIVKHPCACHCHSAPSVQVVASIPPSSSSNIPPPPVSTGSLAFTQLDIRTVRFATDGECFRHQATALDWWPSLQPSIESARA